MTRLERKNRTDIIYKGCGSLHNALDDAIKSAWRINDDEYDFLCEFASDEVLEMMTNDKPKHYSGMKKQLNLINEALAEYKVGEE